MCIKHLICILTIPAIIFTSSCATDQGYSEVSHGGNLYYYDMYGTYYRHYWYGYRPCPKPPGKPDHPHKPTHPIERPPAHKPDRPSTQPINDRPSIQPVTRPSARPSRPSTMPRSRPMPRMHGGGGRGRR